VHGNVPIGQQQRVDARIETLTDYPHTSKTSRVHPNGKPAITLYECVGHYRRNSAPFSLLKVTLLTGRTHQIRCHMQHIGHPVVGDSKYHSRGEREKGDNGKSRGDDRKWCPRTFLHCQQLGFTDLQGDAVVVRWDLPPDLQDVLSVGMQPA